LCFTDGHVWLICHLIIQSTGKSAAVKCRMTIREREGGGGVKGAGSASYFSCQFVGSKTTMMLYANNDAQTYITISTTPTVPEDDYLLTETLPKYLTNFMHLSFSETASCSDHNSLSLACNLSPTKPIQVGGPSCFIMC
jgi:hypothetical protein